MPKLPCVTAIGMSCPVGLYAQAACAAIRAGIVRFQGLPYQDNKGRAIVGSYVPSLPFSLRSYRSSKCDRQG
jgi:3-oxoacyl-[acyl-carrier-protein] synthase-1